MSSFSSWRMRVAVGRACERREAEAGMQVHRCAQRRRTVGQGGGGELRGVHLSGHFRGMVKRFKQLYAAAQLVGRETRRERERDREREKDGVSGEREREKDK